MGKLESIFNCQKCGKALWLNYYRLPDGRTVCPKCFDLFICSGEIEKIKKRMKNFDKEIELLSALNRKEFKDNLT